MSRSVSDVLRDPDETQHSPSAVAPLGAGAVGERALCLGLGSPHDSCSGGWQVVEGWAVTV